MQTLARHSDDHFYYTVMIISPIIQQFKNVCQCVIARDVGISPSVVHSNINKFFERYYYSGKT